MPTLEERIADLQDQAGQLLDLPQQIADTAQARINQIGTYWATRVQQMRTVTYVHQQSGDDDADGTESAPIRSVEEALRRTPPGGVCEVRLLGGYHFAGVVTVSQTYLVMTSASSVRHAITLERLTYQAFGTTKRKTGGPLLTRRAAVRYTGVTLIVPVLDGTWGSYEIRHSHSGFAQLGDSVDAGGALVSITECDIRIPQTPYCAVVGNDYRMPVELYVTGCVATDQPLTGRLLSGATDPSGTAAASLPWLVTNLTTV